MSHVNPHPQPQPQPAYIPMGAQMYPPYVVVPQSKTNGLAVFGFLVALIGLFVPTGIVALLGLLICLAAMGRAPRGLAAAGVVLGLIGSALWLVVMVAALVAAAIGMVAVVVIGALAFTVMQPELVEVTADMVNVAVATAEYEQENDELPQSLDDLKLTVPMSTDPWGTTYKLVLIDDEPGFNLISAGADTTFDTHDDITLLRLEHIWEDTFEDFEDQMEEFGERMERLDGYGHDMHGSHIHAWAECHEKHWECESKSGMSDRTDYAQLYEDQVDAEQSTTVASND